LAGGSNALLAVTAWSIGTEKLADQDYQH